VRSGNAKPIPLELAINQEHELIRWRAMEQQASVEAVFSGDMHIAPGMHNSQLMISSIIEEVKTKERERSRSPTWVLANA